jgi:hypothetical protein
MIVGHLALILLAGTMGSSIRRDNAVEMYLQICLVDRSEMAPRPSAAARVAARQVDQPGVAVFD